MQLFLDCDGVLADFDKKAIEIFGMHPREFEKKYGKDEFWKAIANSSDFFYELEEMEDAHELYEGTKHLDPIILTGAPLVAAEWGPDQKKRWVARMFGPTQRVIVCRSKNKYLHGKPGDILIDDWEEYMHKWTKMGGIWITHISAKRSLSKLEQLGIL